MWILECDGDFLQGLKSPLPFPQVFTEGLTGKKLWLKPGQRYLFGRVKRDGGKSTASGMQSLSLTSFSSFSYRAQVYLAKTFRH